MATELVLKIQELKIKDLEMYKIDISKEMKPIIMAPHLTHRKKTLHD